jgi:MFS family permease
MDKWIKVLMWLTAAVFFFLGALALPFAPWLSNHQGSDPILGWVIFLVSIAFPWAIAFAIGRYALRKNED